MTLSELNVLLKSIRKDQTDERVFLAALQGVDLDKYAENGSSVEEKRKEIERRAKEKLLGREEVERQEFAEFGISFEEI